MREEAFKLAREAGQGPDLLQCWHSSMVARSSYHVAVRRAKHVPAQAARVKLRRVESAQQRLHGQTPPAARHIVSGLRPQRHLV
jgi:hypothetical protein